MSFRPSLSESVVPESEGFLNLNYLRVHNVDTENFISNIITQFRELPSSITSLTVTGNYKKIHPCNIELLIRLFSAMPVRVSSLNLRGFLDGRDGLDDLFFALTHILDYKKVLKAIPPNVTSLDLSENRFGLRTSRDIPGLFKGIPTSITELNLSRNQFQHCSETIIKDILKSIPSNIRSLNLSGNGLHLKTDEELANISKSLPYVLEIQADDLPAEKLAILNRYNGWKNIKRIHHELENKLPDALSPIVLSYLTSHSEKDIFHGITKSPPKSSFNLALALGFLATIMAIAYTYTRTSTMNI